MNLDCRKLEILVEDNYLGEPEGALSRTRQPWGGGMDHC